MWSNFKELRQELEKRKATCVGGVMRDAVTVDEGLPLSRAADLIVNKKANRLVRSVPDLLRMSWSPVAGPGCVGRRVGVSCMAAAFASVCCSWSWVATLALTESYRKSWRMFPGPDGQSCLVACSSAGNA